MIAVDTNILIYAHREDAQWHDIAYSRLTELAEGRTPWAIPWPCLHEFLAIVTHPRIYGTHRRRPYGDRPGRGLARVPLSLTLLAESERYWPDLRATLQEGRNCSIQVHDARVAALCRLHGVRELWTVDRDFGRFSGLTARNPLSADGVSSGLRHAASGATPGREAL